MPKRDLFNRKLLDKLDRVDRQSVQDYLRGILSQNDLYEEIFGHLNEGVLVLSGKGEIQFINRQASLWLNINIKPTKAPVILDVLEDKILSRSFKHYLKNPIEKVVEDIALMNPQEKILRVFFIPLEKSTTGDFLVLLQDINAGQDQSVWDERMANIEALVNLTAGIAHEIGNPLNSISIHLQLLANEVKRLEGAKKAKFKKTLDVIQNETGRLDKIVRNFLKATRKPPLRYRSQDLNAALQEAIDFLMPELKKNKVSVHFTSDKALPFFLFDKERLYSVFMNLMINAMEAMPTGGKLEIQVAHKNNVVSIRFKDKGRGIAEKDLPHIFDTYYTTKKEGSGLGLMTVFNAIRDHGGRIEVDSKLNKGTTFTLLLPIRKPKLQLPEYKAS